MNNMEYESGLWIAVDPGLTVTAYCLFNPYTRVIVGVKTIRPKGDKYLWLTTNYKHVFELYKPAVVIVESPFKDGFPVFLHHGGGAGTALNVGKGSVTAGLIYGLAVGMGIEARELAPAEWNASHISKKGGAVKAAMIKKYGVPDDKVADYYDSICMADYCISQYWNEQRIKTRNLLRG
jgi:hypothetical protein